MQQCIAKPMEDGEDDEDDKDDKDDKDNEDNKDDEDDEFVQLDISFEANGLGEQVTRQSEVFAHKNL